jgi:hypothetical protein
MVGSGSVVTHDVPAHGVVWGNPARLHGFVCTCGARLTYKAEHGQNVQTRCPQCGQEIEIPIFDWQQIQNHWQNDQ